VLLNWLSAHNGSLKSDRRSPDYEAVCCVVLQRRLHVDVLTACSASSAVIIRLLDPAEFEKRYKIQNTNKLKKIRKHETFPTV